MTFNESTQDHEENRSEYLIQKIKLKAGEELSLIKRFSDGNSDLKVGHILKGKLKNNVHIGLPIEFQNGGSTSNIKSLKVENGKYVIKTMTSIYEIQNILPKKELNNILRFDSFKTEKGSVYNVLEDGRVQRIKHALDDPGYFGEDKGQKKEREPSDIMLFYDYKKSRGWLDDFGAIDPVTDKEISRVIDLGVYKKTNEGNYRLIKNSAQISEPFIFLRVRKDDSFKLKESLDPNEIRDFQKRTFRPENKGLGILILSEEGIISNIPKIGLHTLDYKYDASGEILSMHNGNKVVSIKEKK